MNSQSIQKIANLPWAFLMIIYLGITYLKNIPLEGMAGYLFVGLGVVVLFIEFFKSGSVSATGYIIDLLFALVAVIISTSLLTYLYFVLNKLPNFFYWFGYAIIIGDAIFSPFNSYRMALRNFGVAE